ncbi:MAG TPA: SMC-Scp complex subunit ScpB [Chthoniobacterales bacterium]
MVSLKAIVEALMFSSPKPLSPNEIVQVLKAGADYLDGDNPSPEAGEAKEAEVRAALETLAREYNDLGRAFQLQEQASGWQLASRPGFQAWVRQLFPELRPTRLSAPALETLAIVAYRQPITRADIEAIRGVAVEGVMQKLLETGLVRIGGRAEVPGRPLLYETTEHFMEHFGLRTLDELPNATELRHVPLPSAPLRDEGTPAEAPTARVEDVEPEIVASPRPMPDPTEDTSDGRTEAGKDPATD